MMDFLRVLDRNLNLDCKSFPNEDVLEMDTFL